VERRIGDGRIVRLIPKWLKAGVLGEGQRLDTLEGTPQGAVISSLLANIYLHYVYDYGSTRGGSGTRRDLIVVRYAERHDRRLPAQIGCGPVPQRLGERLGKFSSGRTAASPCSFAARAPTQRITPSQPHLALFGCMPSPSDWPVTGAGIVGFAKGASEDN
jgi:hypothetical protein